MKNYKYLRILVTGSTGFLGSNIIKALTNQANVQIIATCRQAEKLASQFKGEVRVGDLMDANFRREVVNDVDVICNAASWASMWGHRELERKRFFEPALDLIEQAIGHGVTRFIQASTVAIGAVEKSGRPIDDYSPTHYSHFWPHLDRLIDLDCYMRANSNRGMQMVTMRLGHFVGIGNRMGVVPALLPRLRTYLVPWLARGQSRMPLIADTDLGNAFALAATAKTLKNYESFNICGAEFPTLHEVIEFITEETELPKPLYSVPFHIGYAFAWLMEKLYPVLPGSSPFLTQSIVRLCENWVCSSNYAYTQLAYAPEKNWRTAMREHIAELKKQNYPWPSLRQST